MSTDYRTKAERDAAERFPRDTAKHKMIVLHDDGLYRHLRFLNPRHGQLSSFDLITWPDHLAISGDVSDAYVFTRLRDMFQFFRGHEVNPGYWSEKLQGDSRRVQVYDRDSFERQVKAHVVEAIREGDAPRGIGAEVTREIFEWGEIDDESSARKELENFRFQEWTFGDTWEWNFSDWDHGFLRACHSIVWGVARYDRMASYGLQALVTQKQVAA